MKRTINVNQSFLLLFSVTILAACSGSRKTANPGEFHSPELVDNGYQQVDAIRTNRGNTTVNPNKDRPSNNSLNDMLLRLPGVSVQGSGAYAKITISGAASFMSATDPLFVLNGTVVGSDYSRIYNTVNPNDVTSVDVLKGPDASIYGSRGANGVILIRTK